MEQRGGTARAWVVAFLAVGLLQACGGGGGGGASPQPPLPPPPPPPSAPAAPVITAQPATAYVLQDGTASFTVAATGASGYEWQQSPDGTTWTDVAGGTAATLNAAEPLSASGLQYRVIVSGAGGKATSAAVGLTVYPMMALQPASKGGYTGQDVYFSGGPTFDLVDTSRQWQESHDGQSWNDIAGATDQILTLHDLALTDDGLQVRLVVTAFGHTYTSDVARLSVATNPAVPVFVVQPLDATVAAGGDARFSSWISYGSAQNAYQWQSSGDHGATWSAVPGANMQVLLLPAVGTGDDGRQLRMQVTNGGGTYFSQTATLHVGAAGAGRLDLLAGALGGGGDLDATGTAAWLTGPGLPTFDAQGNLFFLDSSRFKRLDPQGRVTSLAGRSDTGGSWDGSGAAALLYGIFGSGTVVASNGDAYVAEAANNLIRKITADGTVSTFAGKLQSGAADGTGTAATFNGPLGLAIDGADNLYVADTGNHTIRRITPAGVVSTLAGTAGTAGSSDGLAGTATLNTPRGIAVDRPGQVVSFTDQGNTVRQWTAAAGVKTLAGTAGASGATDATGAAARFNRPIGLATDPAGTLFVVDAGNMTIRQVTSAGVVTTLAGLAGAKGDIDGAASDARFSSPVGIALAPDGSLAVSDGTTVRRIAGGAVTTLAGSIEPQGQADGVGTVARFDLPRSVIADASGNLVVGDGRGLQRRVARDGTTTTFDTGGYADGMTLDAAGNLIVADSTFDCVVRRASLSGGYSVLAGNSANCNRVDGNGTQAGFFEPRYVARGLSGEIFVIDGAYLRRIAPNGDVTTLSQSDASKVDCHAAEGPLATASFCAAGGLVADDAGNLFIADGQAVRRVDAATQQVTTFAGSPTALASVSIDGHGTDARFDLLNGIARDAAGNLYVSDMVAGNVRRIDPAGNVTTVFGRAGINGIVLGTAPALYRPMGVAVMDSTHLAVVSMDAVLVYTLPGGTPLAAKATRTATKARAH